MPIFNQPLVDPLEAWGAGSSSYIQGQKNDSTVYINASMTADKLYAIPVSMGGKINTFAVNIVSILGAGTPSLVIGLYSTDAGFNPVQKIWQSTPMTTTGQQIFALPSDIYLPPGIYWLVVLASGTFNLQGTAANYPWAGTLPGQNRDYNYRQFVGTYPYTATLPNPLPLTSYIFGALTVPVLYFKKS